MIEIMEKSERSYLVCNVTKNTKKHTQLYHEWLEKLSFCGLTHDKQFYGNAETNSFNNLGKNFQEEMKVCAGTWHKLKSTNRSKCNL